MPSVAAAVAAEIRALGAEYFFLVTGRDNFLWIALQQAGIRQLLARTESAAVYMADGYARITGRPTFVYGGYGPGAANVAGALAEPMWSSSPIVAMPSAMRRADRFRGEYQEMDQLQLFQSVTKWAAEPYNAPQVPRFIREGARRAISGTPGPVYVGIPGDIYEEELPGYREPTPLTEPLALPIARPAPTDEEVESVVEAVKAADRPIILVGNGIHQSGAYEPLRQVAERLAVPVATSMAGKGSIPETHELALGPVGRYSRNYANDAVRNADLIVAIGTGLGGMITDSYKLIPPDAHLIHVNVDGEPIGQNFPTRTAVVADARTFLTAVLRATDRLDGWHRNGGSSGSRHVEDVAAKRQAWRDRRDGLASQDGLDGRPMRPEAVMAVMEELLSDDAIIAADTGYSSAWSGAILDRPTSGRTFLRADGSLGWAFAGAMGAQLAEPERPVIAVIGDGGFGYHVGDLETALRLKLPVVTVILNNRTLAFEAHVQTLLYDHLVPEVDDFLDVDYAAVARSFGANGIRVENATEFRHALASGLERRGPTVIDAIIDRDAIAPVTRYDRVREREL